MLVEAFKGAKQWAMQQFWWTEWWMTLVKIGGCAIEYLLVQENTALWHYIVNFWYKLLDSKTDINENEGHTSLSDAPKKKFHHMDHRSHGVTNWFNWHSIMFDKWKVVNWTGKFTMVVMCHNLHMYIKGKLPYWVSHSKILFLHKDHSTIQGDMLTNNLFIGLTGPVNVLFICFLTK